MSDEIGDIEKELTKKWKEEDAEKERRDASKRKEEKKYKEFKKRNLRKSLKYSKKIFSWIGELSNDKRVKRILEKEHDIRLFSDEYYDFKPGGFGCVADVLMNKNGSITYRERYKSMGYHLNNNFNDYKQFAETLDPRFIESLSKHIKSGKVWKTVRKELLES